MHVTEKGDVVIRKLNSKISNDTRVITRERDLCYLGEFTNNFSVIRLHSQSVWTHVMIQFLAYKYSLSLGAFAASELDKVFSGYQPR